MPYNIRVMHFNERIKEVTMKCLNCKKEIIKTRKWHKFCSDVCRYTYWDKMNPRMRKGRDGKFVKKEV